MDVNDEDPDYDGPLRESANIEDPAEITTQIKIKKTDTPYSQTS
jgi:hypothetical protein